MARKPALAVRGSSDEPVGTRQAIFNAAIETFFAKGYEAATLREIARKVGLQVGSLYNHLESKQELLFDIMHGIMEDLLREMDGALAGHVEPVDRLRTAVQCHIVFHATRMQEVFIGNSELRSLTPANRRRVVKLRDQYERIFEGIIRDGQRAGAFQVDDVKIATYAVLAMCTGVSGWYSRQGRLSVTELARLYGDLALRALGVAEAAASADRPTALSANDQ